MSANFNRAKKDFKFSFSSYGYLTPSQREDASNAVKELLCQLDLPILSDALDNLSDRSSEIIETFLGYERPYKETIDGKPKKGGRRSYLESNPSLVFKTEELRSRGYKHKEISKALFDMGFVNGKGKEIAPTQISRILKQAKKVKTA